MILKLTLAIVLLLYYYFCDMKRLETRDEKLLASSKSLLQSYQHKLQGYLSSKNAPSAR